MIVKYQPKVDHIKCIPLIPDLKNPKSYNRQQVQLLPGTNEVTEDEWENIKPHIAREIANKEISLLVVEKKGKGKGAKSVGLKDLPLSLASKQIEACVNPGTLKKWFKEVGNDEVLLLVSKRMRKLKIDPEDVEKEIDGEKDDEGGDGTGGDEGSGDGDSGEGGGDFPDLEGGDGGGGE